MQKLQAKVAKAQKALKKSEKPLGRSKIPRRSTPKPFCGGKGVKVGEHGSPIISEGWFMILIVSENYS